MPSRRRTTSALVGSLIALACSSITSVSGAETISELFDLSS
jgi:hypothetical protein